MEISPFGKPVLQLMAARWRLKLH